MARTLETIYNQIITEKETYSTLSNLTPINDTYQTLLSNLTSTSKVAVWRLWCFVYALAIWFHEQVFDAHKAEVEEMIINNQLGQLRWYVEKAKEFQYGFDLAWDGTKYIYLTEDSDSKIINQAAALDGDGVVLVKVAKYVTPTDPNNSELEQLTTAQESALEAYMSLIKPAGIQLQTINQAADVLDADISIFYDALLLTASGQLIEDSSTTELKAGDLPAKVALDTYLKSIPFNSRLRVVDLVDALQAAEGVENVVVTKCQAKSGTNPYTDILAVSNQSYTTNSGYFKPSTSFYTLTYTASN